MDFEIPADITALLERIDDFIEREIKPLEQQDDNIRFFDHRREYERTDWDRGGVPREEWEALLGEAKRRADAAGHYRYPFPAEWATVADLTRRQAPKTGEVVPWTERTAWLALRAELATAVGRRPFEVSPDDRLTADLGIAS